MKKLVVFSVIFALVSGAAFAQLSIGGQLQIGMNLLSGDTDEDSYVKSGQIAFPEMKANLNFGDAALGGKLVLYSAKYDNLPGHFDNFAFLWWRPIEKLRLQFGRNPDGDFGFAQITGWGFTAEAKNNVAAISDYSGGLYMDASRGGFMGGFDKRGFTASFNATDDITINLALPQSGGYESTASNTPAYKDYTAFVLGRFYANAVIGLPDIGTARIGYQSGLGHKDADADSWWVTEINDPGKIWASFYLMAIDGMGLDVGLGYTLPYTTTSKSTRNAPIEAGLGFRYTAGDFGFKVRTGLKFAGSTTPDGGDARKDDTLFGIGILPSYKIGGLTAFFHAGLGMSIPDEGDSLTDWFINPYIQFGKFYAGLQVWSDGKKEYGKNGDETKVNFAVPLGINFYF